jgi:hypothetical protein
MLAQIRYRLAAALGLQQTAALTARRARLEDLRADLHRRSPRALGGHGYKIFSQSDEDGIIAEIFRRIGTTSRTFVEFGVGDGLENNTAALLYEGWSGLWIDGSDQFCRQIANTYAPAIGAGQLAVVNSFITVDNIDLIIADKVRTGEIDLLSVDIDGNDSHVFRAIRSIDPRVVVFEYNAKFGPSIDYCMAYQADYVWRKSDRFGASLKHFENIMRDRGYSCVGCNIVGTNSFFVRDDLLADHFEGPFTSEAQFQPARYELAGLPSGHPVSADTFRTRAT